MGFDRVMWKRQARRDMQGKSPNVMLVTLLYLVLTAGVTAAVSALPSNQTVLRLTNLLMEGTVNNITGEELVELLRAQGANLLGAIGIGFLLSVLVSLFTVLMQFGYTAYTLGLAKGQKMGFGSLLTGFGMMGRVLALSIVTAVFSFLWALAVFAGAGVLIALVMWLVGSLLDMAWLAVVLMYVLFAGAYVLLFAIILRYAVAPWALADDPEQGALGALNYSKEIMIGHRWELFKLAFSFLGWYLVAFLLALVAASVGFIIVFMMTPDVFATADMVEGLEQMGELMGNSWIVTVAVEVVTILFSMWLTPYMMLTESHFYLVITGQEPASPQSGMWTRQPGVGGTPPAPPAPPVTPPPSYTPPVSVPFTPPAAMPEPPAEHEVPAEPAVPAEPEPPAEPAAPAEPEAPAEPAVPAEPEAPAEPELPAEPEVPAEEPAAPAEPEEKRDDPWAPPADSRRNPF